MSHLWHVVKVNSILQTESGIVVDGEAVGGLIVVDGEAVGWIDFAVPLKRDVKEQLEWILAKNEIMKKMTETMKKMTECKERTSVECNWSANLANKMPPISKMCLFDMQDGQLLIFFNNENRVVAWALLDEDKSMVDEGCLELLEKSQEKMWRRLEEEEDAKRKEEDAKRCQRKARNEENELRRREEERQLMESREKARSAGLLARKFEQGKVAFFAKDWGR